ncbi:MAG TPA: hypothetical protein VEP48_05295 [Methylomirabilota bacterium]|nr:hypothetical protein [Methylomirabilota bacterium]
MRRGARVAWIGLAAIVVPLMAVAVGRWLWALFAHVPILYGEGAVAHAALLARDRLEYVTPAAGDQTLFVAANYPPLYFHLASVGDPFVTGRILSIAATVAVALAIAMRARPAGLLAATAIAASWIASAPVAIWGAAIKPDLVALAFTVGAVVTVGRRPLLAGALIALAVWAKPTAGLPALALAAYLVAQDRGALPRYLGGALASIAAAAVLTVIPDSGMLEHVVTWNALPWHPEQVLLISVLGLVVAGAVVLVSATGGALRGPLAAYAVAALGVVVFGGREGATINYLLDLTTVAWLGVAGIAPRLATGIAFPITLAAQTLFAIALLDPLGVLPGRAITTGAWAPPARIDVVRAIPGRLLVEDAGLLVVDGRAAAVDDIFLWSRLESRGDFALGDRLLVAARDGAFDAIVSETDLDHIATAPTYEQQRWDTALVTAVLSRYRLDREAGGLFIYARR